MQVQSVTEGTVYGRTVDQQGYWESVYAKSINVVNMGGNIGTTQLYAPPLNITIDGLTCELTKVGLSQCACLA